MSAQVVRHLSVRGRVQGVGYRAFVEREALKRSVEGWARNRKDGSVEAVLAGVPEAVKAVIEVCRRGPFNARVDAIDQRDGTDAEFALRHAGELFSVLRDA
ncbi:MAG TPA: acylphosphatase [Pseudolabrys sp.]|jgi:acylphosphatase